MSNAENPAFFNNWQGFEVTQIASEKEIVPKTIVTETRTMMGNVFAGQIPKEVSKDYIEYYTFPFLRKAARGAGSIYDRKILFTDLENVDLREAADFTQVVFSTMHYYARSNILPNGFSKKGILKAPSTKGEFISRVVEIGETLPRMLEGDFRGNNLWGHQNALRTLAFFEVGSVLPLKNEDRDKETVQRLLDGINLSF